MNYSPPDLRQLVAALLAAVGMASCVFLAGVALADDAAGVKAGVVAEQKGSATASAGGADRALAVGGDVLIGDLIKTDKDARLSLKLGERTTLKLGAETEIRIDRYLADAGGNIDLVEGALLFDRTGEPATEGFEVESVYGLIAVRGTRFYAGPSKEKFGVFVERGRVEVTGAGKTVPVGAEEGTDIASPGAEPTPAAKWRQPRIDALKALVD